MKAKQMYIHLEGIKLYGYHGVAAQETVVGSYFYIDLKVKTDFCQAAATDELTNTISYADIFEVVKERMKVPSLLLENLAHEIVKELFEAFSTIEEIEIKVSKENPPMGADCEKVGVQIVYTR